MTARNPTSGHAPGMSADDANGPIFLRKGQRTPPGFVSVAILTHAQLIRRLDMERARDVTPGGAV